MIGRQLDKHGLIDERRLLDSSFHDARVKWKLDHVPKTLKNAAHGCALAMMLSLLALVACGDNYIPIEPDAGRIHLHPSDARSCTGDAGCVPTCESLGCTPAEYTLTCAKLNLHDCVCHMMSCEPAPCCDPAITKNCDTSGLPLCGA